MQCCLSTMLHSIPAMWQDSQVLSEIDIFQAIVRQSLPTDKCSLVSFHCEPDVTFRNPRRLATSDFLWTDSLTGSILWLTAEPPSGKIDSWHGNELVSPEMSSLLNSHSYWLQFWSISKHDKQLMKHRTAELNNNNQYSRELGLNLSANLVQGIWHE